MKKNNLLYITASLMVLSSTVQADNVKVQEDDPEMTCEKLGYTVPVSECLEQGTIPLLCPFATGETDDVRMSLCYSESCRGFPLWKEDGVYYHLDKNGNKIVAAPENGHIGDYIEGGEAALLSCKTGLASDARTYYKVKKCKDKAILDYDICANGCGKNKYPYDKHPGDLAGAVASCEDEEGEHFGYTSCNDGWVFTDGKCILADCDIKQFPYMSDPNLINDEYRGETKTCRIGGNIYYRYLACDTEQTDDENNPIYQIKKGICIKRCPLQNCTSTPVTIEKCIPIRNEQNEIVSYDSCTYNDWNCDIDSTCRIGDLVTFDGIDLGYIFHLKDETFNKTLITGLSIYGKIWAQNEYQDMKITTLTAPANYKLDHDGKSKTRRIIEFAPNYATNYPLAATAYNYTRGCSNGSVCAQYEWYLLASGDTEYLYANKYILYNIFNNGNFLTGTWGTSSEGSSDSFYQAYIERHTGTVWKKYTSTVTSPVLAF